MNSLFLVIYYHCTASIINDNLNSAILIVTMMSMVFFSLPPKKRCVMPHCPCLMCGGGKRERKTFRERERHSEREKDIQRERHPERNRETFRQRQRDLQREETEKEIEWNLGSIKLKWPNFHNNGTSLLVPDKISCSYNQNLSWNVDKIPKISHSKAGSKV